jgi:hypothetical protein
MVKNSFKPIFPLLHYSIIPIGAKPLSSNMLSITGFIIFFHRERASFFVRKFPGREFPPYQREIFPIG